MSLNWLWANKCGEAVRRQLRMNENKELVEHDFTFDLYNGNAFLIFIYNYDEDGQKMYQVNDFWVDETHMKRMLGIDKKDKETLGDNREDDIIKFTFYKDKCRYLKKIVSAITEAFDNIEIEILATAPTKEEN